MQLNLRMITGAWCIACFAVGCAGDDTETEGTIALHASLDEGTLVIECDSTFKPYVDMCHDVFELSTWSGTKWVPAQDDRTTADEERGYFLDGAFVQPSGSAACDKRTACVEHPTYTGPHNLAEVMITFQARAFVKVGTQPAPDAKNGAPEVDVIETKPLTGRIQVTNFYYRDDACSGEPESITAEAFPIGQ